MLSYMSISLQQQCLPAPRTLPVLLPFGLSATAHQQANIIPSVAEQGREKVGPPDVAAERSSEIQVSNR